METGAGVMDLQGVQEGSLGGQESGRGEEGQLRRAVATRCADRPRMVSLSGKGERTARPWSKVLRKVKWRCDVIN